MTVDVKDRLQVAKDLQSEATDSSVQLPRAMIDFVAGCAAPRDRAHLLLSATDHWGRIGTAPMCGPVCRLS